MSALTVAAWVVFWNPASIATFAEHSGGLDEALVEWAGVDEQGLPFRRPRKSEQETMLREAARTSGTRLWGMASNYVDPTGFDVGRMTLMLNDPVRRRGHIEALAKIAEEDRLAGIDLDYESLKETDRDAYTVFVRDLAAALHRGKRRLSVTVHPKVDDGGGWDGPRAQDYREIGKAADVVRIMAYDYSWSGAPAGPIAPDEWVRRVALYAKSRIPARKISLGIPCYGYDWGKSPATSLVWNDFLGLLATGKADPATDSGEEVADAARFGGATSLARKAGIARELGLGGISFWYVGSEEPRTWDVLATLRPRKR